MENNLTEQRVNQLEEAQWSVAINVDGTGSGDRIYWSMGRRNPQESHHGIFGDVSGAGVPIAMANHTTE